MGKSAKRGERVNLPAVAFFFCSNVPRHKDDSDDSPSFLFSIISANSLLASTGFAYFISIKHKLSPPQGGMPSSSADTALVWGQKRKRKNGKLANQKKKKKLHTPPPSSHRSPSLKTQIPRGHTATHQPGHKSKTPVASYRLLPPPLLSSEQNNSITLHCIFFLHAAVAKFPSLERERGGKASTSWRVQASKLILAEWLSRLPVIGCHRNPFAVQPPRLMCRCSAVP